MQREQERDRAERARTQARLADENARESMGDVAGAAANTAGGDEERSEVSSDSQASIDVIDAFRSLQHGVIWCHRHSETSLVTLFVHIAA